MFGNKDKELFEMTDIPLAIRDSEIIKKLNDTTEISSSISFREKLKKNCEIYAEKYAFIDEQSHMTYQELKEFSDKLNFILLKKYSLKHGDKVTLKNVDISSDITITETVDTSKYTVWISKKEEKDESYSAPVEATMTGNTAVMKQRIEAARGDVIKLKITNKNTESIPETGIHLTKNQQVCILLVISIAVGLIFWRKNKNKAMRR